MAFENFPFTDLHNLNLDWLLSTVKNLDSKWDNYYTQWDAWQHGITDYIDNLDYIGAIDSYMDNLKDSGQLSDILGSWVGNDYNVVMIGDSYAQGYTPDGVVDSWAKLLQTKYFADQTCFIQAEGGSGFVAVGQSGNTFGQLMELVASKMTTTQRQHTKYVIVCGGWNDMSASGSAITSKIEAFVSSASVLFENSEVAIGYVAAPSASYLNTLDRFNNWRAAKLAYETTFAAYHMLANVNLALRWDGVLASDSIHPNATGNASIADCVYKSLMGNYQGGRFNDSISITTSGGTLNVTVAKLKYNNSVATITPSSAGKLLAITYSTPAPTVNASTVYTLAVIHTTCIPESAICNCHAIVNDSTGYHDCDATLYWIPDNGATRQVVNNLQFKLTGLNSAGSDFVKFTNVKSIQFYGVEFNIPLT